MIPTGDGTGENMLKKIKMVLSVPDEVNFNYNKSSLLHGVIMENLTEDYAEKMHESFLKPYSQNIRKTADGKYIWTVSVLNSEADDKIIKKLSFLDEIYIKHNDITVNIESREITGIKYDTLFEENYFGDRPSPYVSMEFITPTAFKTDRKYINYPTVQNIFSNLIRRYDTFSERSEIYDENMMNELVSASDIVSYDLKSTLFHLEGVKIPSFTGKITIKVRAHDSMKSLVHLLADFAEYSGIGIKTALGMGSVIHKESYSEKGKKQ